MFHSWPRKVYLRPARDEDTTYTVGGNCSRVDGDKRTERIEPRSYSPDALVDPTDARNAGGRRNNHTSFSPKGFRHPRSVTRGAAGHTPAWIMPVLARGLTGALGRKRLSSRPARSRSHPLVWYNSPLPRRMPSGCPQEGSGCGCSQGPIRNRQCHAHRRGDAEGGQRIRLAGRREAAPVDRRIGIAGPDPDPDPGLTHHNSESGLARKPCLLVKFKLLDHLVATFR